MTDPLEDRLHALTTPPPVGDPVARVLARRRRGDRRRGVAALLAVAVAVGGIAFGAQSLTGSTPPVPADASGVVPYALRLAPAAFGPAFDDSPSGLPGCVAGDLTAVAGQPDAVEIGVEVVLTVTNGGPACQLDARAGGQVVAEDGAALQAGLARGPAFSPPPPLAAGGQASTTFAWSTWCGPDPGRWSLRLDLDRDTGSGPGLPVEVPGGAPVPGCPSGLDGFYEFGPWTVLNDLGQPLLDPQAALVATVTGPDSAPLGGVLPMVVELANPTRGPIALDPCPQYGWSVDRSGPGSFLRGSPPLELNCPAAPDAVPAGGSLSFALELPLSPALADGMLAPGRWFVTPGFGLPPRAVEVLPAAPYAPGDCTYVPTADADPRVPGVPSPTAASQAVLQTDRGTVTVALDTARSPCAVAAFAHLVDGGFWDGQPCYAVASEARFGHVDCGSSDLGGKRAGTAFPAEIEPGTTYPAGTVVLTFNETTTNAGSIRVLTRDAPTYGRNFVVLGRVTAGLEVVTQVVDAGGTQDFGPPRLPLTITGVEVS